MNLQPGKGLEDYLRPTEFCDCDNSEVINKAKELTHNDENPKEMALSIFHFVRDQIRFMMCEFDKASETLKRGFGDCGSKTNLQVALLRAVKIPARFHIASLSKDSIKGIVSEFLYQQSPAVIPFHPWCECYLGEKWISCDTLLDRPLVESAYRKGIFTREEIPTIEWDGCNDLNTMTNWMMKDKGMFSSLDQLLLESQKGQGSPPIDRKQMEMVLNQSNEYTDSLREK